MSKRNKIIYWISTAWLGLGMLSTGIVQILRTKEETDRMTHLGFPAYLLIFIGVCKLLGVTAILVPKFPLLKEWAYAGFFFTMAGAIFSHFAVGDAPGEFFGPVLLLILIVVSWYFRPEGRKLVHEPVNKAIA